MPRRALLLGVIAALAFSSVGAGADEDNALPTPEPGVVEVIPGGECVQESRFDAPSRHWVDADGQLLTDKFGETADETPAADIAGARDACERLRIVFGPIMVKPGQNDVLIQPVTFEQPRYDGYLVRFKPNLISADGTPPVEDLHLHHGTWLNGPGRSYGWGPWLASGEEKTIATWPHRFGLKIETTDVWLFLHMVHNATPRPMPVWVVYTMDFINAKDAEVIQEADSNPLLTNTMGIWLDVGTSGRSFHPEAEPYPFNPVFNIHRGFGSEVTDEHTLDLYGPHYDAAGLTPTECTFPRQNCALYNSQNNVSAQQGKDVSGEPTPGNNYPGSVVDGWDFRFNNDLPPEGGTLVMMGGHLHNGGLRAEVQLGRDMDGNGKVSPEEAQLIHISDAYYWYEDQTIFGPDDERLNQIVGGRPVSWDFSMTGVTYDLGWAINVQRGDVLRLNGVFDSAIGSWYEQMGIVMAWVVPATAERPPFGIDVFLPDELDGEGNVATWKYNDAIEYHLGLPTTIEVPYGLDGELLPQTCEPGPTTLCVRGQVTHPHYIASGNHFVCPGECRPIPGENTRGPLLEGEIYIGGFTFGPLDTGVAAITGIPELKLGEEVRITNLDTGAYMWHTLTRCAAPCTGATSASYPIPDGAYQDLVDERYGSGAYEGEKNVSDLLLEFGADTMDFDSAELGVGLAPSGKISWDFTPEREGLFTFYCRIHPGMRGVFRVVE